MAHGQGCHKCGGFPGNPHKDRAFLVECSSCGTFTCNHHLTIMGACPNCQSGKVKKVLTQRDVKQAKRGGMPGATAAKKGGGGKSNDKGLLFKGKKGDLEDNSPVGMAGGAGGAFQRGGTDVPQSSGGQTGGLTYNPADAIPDNMKNIAALVLQEGQLSDANVTANITIASTGVAEGFSANDLGRGNSNTAASETAPPTIAPKAAPAKPAKAAPANTSDDDKEEAPKDTEAQEAETTEKDELDDLFDDESEAFEFEGEKRDDMAEGEGGNTEEELQDDKPLYKNDNLSPEELALIEEELEAAADRRRARMEGLDTMQKLQKMADLPLKELPPMNSFVDALWGLQGATATKDIQSYESMVKELRETYKKNEKSPQFMMGMVAFEPQDDEVLNRTVLDAIKAMREVYCMIGYGPRTVKYAKPENLPIRLKGLIGSTDQVLGLGIIGLDMHYAPYTLDQQLKILEVQFQLAAELNLLVYINSEKADSELCKFLRSYGQSELPKLVYAGLLNTDEMAQTVADLDMHLCLRPELTYEANSAALARTAAANSVRWLPASGMPHSAPIMYSGQWNQLKYIPETMNKFFAKAFGQREPEEFMALCVSNWARLLFGEPLAKERAGKEDIWADFDPNKKLF